MILLIFVFIYFASVVADLCGYMVGFRTVVDSDSFVTKSREFVQPPGKEKGGT